MKPGKRSRPASPAGQQGRRDGHICGYEDGYYDGRCESIIGRTVAEPVPYRDIRVLYVPEHFPSIDSGIVEALRPMVRELLVAESQEQAMQIAEQMRPDLVLVLNGLHHFTAERMQHLQQSGLRTAIWFADDPYYTDMTVQIAPFADYVFTHERSCISLYEGLGIKKVYYLPLAVNPALYRIVRHDRSKQSDVCFIGTAFWNRIGIIDSIAPYLATKRLHLSGALWDRLQHFPVLQQQITNNAWIDPVEGAAIYHAAKIAINIHRDPLDPAHNKNSACILGTSINPRTYEINACGTLQLTDIREDLSLHYTPGRHIVTYASAEELQSKIDYYLTHEDERREIAWNGLAHTLQEHTYSKRMIMLLDRIFG